MAQSRAFNPGTRLRSGATLAGDSKESGLKRTHRSPAVGLGRIRGSSEANSLIQ